MEKTNCYTLIGAAFEQGIELKRYQDKLQLQIGTSQSYRYLNLARNEAGLLPEIKNGRLMRATALWHNGYPRLMLPEKSARGVLLRIKARQLHFDFPPFAQNLHFYAGGEGLPPFTQCGAHRDVTAKDQLFQLQEDEELFVIDRASAIGIVYCVNGTPRMRPATPEEVVARVHGVAEEAATVQALDWCMGTLITLGVTNVDVYENRREAIRRTQRR